MLKQCWCSANYGWTRFKVKFDSSSKLNDVGAMRFCVSFMLPYSEFGLMKFFGFYNTWLVKIPVRTVVDMIQRDCLCLRSINIASLWQVDHFCRISWHSSMVTVVFCCYSEERVRELIWLLAVVWCEQRREIISAQTEPTDAECDWPSDEEAELSVSLLIVVLYAYR